MNNKLYSDNKDLETLEQLVFTDSSAVVFNLMEDILCLKENLHKANDTIDKANKLLESIYASGVKLDEWEQPLREYLVGDWDERHIQNKP